ncbi:hypothetical protein M0802_011583 [Mischocyttarus mexicanus]|nr:hypothetical protein M0802_011583 [Mischocyttarus mexicanus]
MSVSDTVKVLTDACEQFRHELQTIIDQTEKQKLVLRHIKTFANTEACVKDFQKGYLSFFYTNPLYCYI